MRGYFKGVVAGVAAMAMALPVLAQSQMELNRQAAEDFEKADRRLNEVYRALLPKLPSDHAAKLREAQVTWLRFRDQECAFETMGTVGGSIHPLLEQSCRARLTLERVRHLEGQLNCESGNLSCVH
jgi:uncharacterized protein YecT (DUF1311 family)